MFTARNITTKLNFNLKRTFSTFQHHIKIKRLAMYSSKKYDKKYFNLYKPKDLEITYIENQLNLETVKLASGHDAICAFVNDDLSTETLEKIKNDVAIDKIVLRCAGYDKVNIESAKILKFKIARVKEYSPNAVAEHAACLALTLNRRMKQSIDRVRDGNFELDGLQGFDMFGKTVGVIGTGKIGYAFVNIMKGFGCNILCFDNYPNPLLINDPKVTYVGLDEIFRKSDIISIHSNLNPGTYHLIDKNSLEIMKPGVMILNVSRGPILNTHDVIEGLKSRKIGYLGIDVVEKEEEVFFKDLSSGIITNDDIARLLSFNNVIITPHQAFFTHEAMTNISKVTLDNLQKILNEIHCENLIY